MDVVELPTWRRDVCEFLADFRTELQDIVRALQDSSMIQDDHRPRQTAPALEEATTSEAERAEAGSSNDEPDQDPDLNARLERLKRQLTMRLGQPADMI